MGLEIEEEFEQFKHDVSDEAFIFGRYLVEDDYEDEYGHNEIDNATGILIRKIREYLKNNRPGEFIVTSGWCIIVMTPKRARESRVSERTITNFLVTAESEANDD